MHFGPVSSSVVGPLHAEAKTLIAHSWPPINLESSHGALKDVTLRMTIFATYDVARFPLLKTLKNTIGGAARLANTNYRVFTMLQYS